MSLRPRWYTVSGLGLAMAALACTNPYRLDAPTEMRPSIKILETSHGEDPFIDGVCLSGGGYRAMLFHAGVLLRLNELGLLLDVKRYSSVSGGALTSGILRANWDKLKFDHRGIATNFVPSVIDPVRKLAGKTIDRKSIILGAITPGLRSAHFLVRALRKQVFGDDNLAAPRDYLGRPLFVMNSTDLADGEVWIFDSKGLVGSRKFGFYRTQQINLALAVAASLAYPPFLSPVFIDVSSPVSEVDLEEVDAQTYIHGLPLDFPSPLPPHIADRLVAHWQRAQSAGSRIALTDGGVANNLGTAACSARLGRTLVSDAALDRPRMNSRWSTWSGQLQQVVSLVHEQATSTKRRQQGCHSLAYWTLKELAVGEADAETEAANDATCVSLPDYAHLREKSVTDRTQGQGLMRALNLLYSRLGAGELASKGTTRSMVKLARSFDAARDVASIETRLKELDGRTQEHLINYGYFLAEGAVAQFLARDIRRLIQRVQRNAASDSDSVPVTLHSIYAKWAEIPPDLPYPLHPRAIQDSREQ